MRLALGSTGGWMALVVLLGGMATPLRADERPAPSPIVSGESPSAGDSQSPSKAGESLTLAPEERQHIERMIAQLGDPSYEARQAASKELRAVGLKAFSPLVTATSHKDAEVRRQARWLLDAIYDQALAQRIALFEQGAEASVHQLPAWHRFVEIVGDDADSRRLYLQMLKAEPMLLEAAAAGPTAARSALEAQFQEMVKASGNRPPMITIATARTKFPLGKSAAVLFAACCADCRTLPPQVNPTAFASEELDKAAKPGANPPVARLMQYWYRQPATLSQAYSKLLHASQNGIAGGAALGLPIFNAAKKSNDFMAGGAITALGEAGGKEYLPVLNLTVSSG